MRYSHIVLALLLGSAFAIPFAQPDDSDDAKDFDIDAYNAISFSPNKGAPIGDSATSTVIYDPTAVVVSAIASATAAIASAVATTTDTSSRLTRRESSLTQRDDCSPDTPGNYMQITQPDDSASSFLEWPAFASDALNAIAPPDYVLVDGFQNLQEAAESSTYLTYISSDLTFYDVNQCAAKCDEIQGCSAFNICSSLHLFLHLPHSPISLTPYFPPALSNYHNRLRAGPLPLPLLWSRMPQPPLCNAHQMRFLRLCPHNRRSQQWWPVPLLLRSRHSRLQRLQPRVTPLPVLLRLRLSNLFRRRRD